MALRILPFRQYNEHNVVNLYALDGSATIPGDLATNGDGDAGLLVSINSGDFDKGIEYTSDTYLGKTDYPHIGANGYPKVTGMTFSPCDASNPLGITLRQTATHDENGEKLLYYRQKAIEHQAVLPGEVVPVLTAGLLTLASTAWEDAAGELIAGNIGAAVTASTTTAGKLEVAGGGLRVGKLLAIGSRTAGNTADQFAGSSGSSAAYALIKIEL
jgi:hypothetical protein